MNIAHMEHKKVLHHCPLYFDLYTLTLTLQCSKTCPKVPGTFKAVTPMGTEVGGFGGVVGGSVVASAGS